jgi:hypothetical protein
MYRSRARPRTVLGAPYQLEHEVDRQLGRARPHVILLMTIALFGYQVAFAPVVAAADALNCTSEDSNNRWSGHSLAGGYDGNSGTAEGQDLHQCNNPALIERNGTFYFTNVEHGGTFNDIVQVGMAKCRWPNTTCGSDMFYARGWGRTHTTPGCSGSSDVFPSVARVSLSWNGAARDYKVYHLNNRWRMFIGTNEVYSVPEASICWSPGLASWFGESWDIGDAIGGSAGNHLRITETNTAATENGGFTYTGFNASAACNYGIVSGPFFCDIVNGTTLDIWTNR